MNERRRRAAAGGGSRGFISGVGGSEHCDVIAYTLVVDEHDESGETSGEQRSDESDELLKIQNSF